MPPVQKEVWLTEDQRQQLRAISARFQAKARAATEGLQRLSPEEQQRRLPALQQQARKDLEGVRKEVANVLTSQQLQSYEKIAFRLRVPAALEDARLLGTLNLTDSQRTKLGQIRDNLEEHLHHVQCEAADKAIDVLTPAQQQKLKEQFSEQGW
jgi:Spy/CpxP family protein refolding chaperone